MKAIEIAGMFAGQAVNRGYAYPTPSGGSMRIRLTAKQAGWLIGQLDKERNPDATRGCGFGHFLLHKPERNGTCLLDFPRE